MVLMIFGALMIAGGFASVIYGNYMNNDFSSQLAHYSSGGDPGNIWMILGIIAIVLGIFLTIYGSVKMKKDKYIEQETGGVFLSNYQKNVLNVYMEQLRNGVITKEEYQAKKEKLLNDIQ